MKKINGGQISRQEQFIYGEYTTAQRKHQYAKGILRNNPYISHEKLNNIVERKFEAGRVSKKWFNQARRKYIKRRKE